MHNCSPVDIGKRLKLLRKNYAKANGKRLTQTDLAKQLGYSREQVAKWEVGVQDLTPAQLDQFASFYGVSIDQIVSGIAAENRSISDSLGLTDESIESLKRMKCREDDYQESFIESTDLTEAPSKYITEGGVSE